MFSDPILGCYGVRQSGVTPGSYGPTSDQSPAAGGSIAVPQVTVDEWGRVTSAANKTITLPAGGSGGGSEWSPTPAYSVTLDSQWYYDDEDANIYEIPASVFGNGLRGIVIDVVMPDFPSEQYVSLFFNNTYYLHGPNNSSWAGGKPHYTFVYEPVAGIGRVMAYGCSLRGGDITGETISAATLEAVNNEAPLITSAGLTHSSLPAGTKITVYVPAS